jgi:predicted nucleotidyltransferase
MLSTIISSKTKRAILKQFLSNPQQKYYVRQIALILNISVGTIHRELVKLEESGILNSENVANSRFFYVNQANPLFKELKQLIFKSEGLEGRLRELLKDLDGLKAAFIYGSFAEGKERADSDVDLFLLGQLQENELVRKISHLELEFSREINYTIYTEDEFKKEKQKRNSFILSVIKGPKIFIKGAKNDIE